MPVTKAQRRRAYVRLNLPWRRLMGRRTVRRRVQGVDLFLPWSHSLPDFAKRRPYYGQNLVALARALGARQPEGPISVLDIGANVGDSAAQIMAATPAHVLCVEGDPYWARYLRMNLGADSRVTIVEALLVPDDAGDHTAKAVRSSHGTTHFAIDSAASDGLPRLSVAELQRSHPALSPLRLVKSDTDGFDVMLVPAVADAFRHDGPALFFEYDPVLSRSATTADPYAMWDHLGTLGYEHVAVWDNTGDALGRLRVHEAAEAARSLEPRPVHLGYDFWDVAAVRGDDSAGIAALDELMDAPFTLRGVGQAVRSR